MNIKIDVPQSFFSEEVRIGYTITEEMKKVWAVQIDLLCELKRVCEKYGIEYFADSGTLLGAIRHQGYIPWDDDIDIVIKRKDYDKLIAVAEKEFENPYFLQSAHSEYFPRGYARLRNSDSTALTKADLGKDINHGIFIDIFPLDYLPDDLSERERWLKELLFLYRCLTVGSEKKPNDYSGFTKSIKYYLYKLTHNMIGYKKLFELYENKCRKYNEKKTKEISYVAYSLGKKKHIWNRACFDGAHIVPFEFIEIPIPDGYDSRLKVEYHDYMKIVRAGTTHGRMILNPDIPYSDYLRKHSKDEIQNMINSKY